MDGSSTIKRGRNAAIFCAVVAVWLALDMATKAYFDTFAPGTIVSGSILGLIQFCVAHNTGGAWGIFNQSTAVLGVLSLVVCAGITIYLFTAGKRASVLEVVGAALIVAGGIGNAINRFTLGYVVDFIDAIFIEFPTFNVADIGVTCGFVLFFAGLFFSTKDEPEHPPAPPVYPPQPPVYPQQPPVYPPEPPVYPAEMPYGSQPPVYPEQSSSSAPQPPASVWAERGYGPWEY